MGGCDALNNALADEFAGEYRPCYPALSTIWKGAFTYHYDYYVDISLRGRTLTVKAVQIADRQAFDRVVHHAAE